MYRHAYFDLWLHDDGELLPFVQSEILERVTLHEWPLSCVQRLTLDDGRKLIYKVQCAPTVEPDFYTRARSGLLVPAQTIFRSSRQACMLLDFVDAPLLRDLNLPDRQVVRIGRQVMEQIAGIEGELACFLDISSEDKWSELVGAMLSDLGELIDRDKFKRVDKLAVHRIEQRAYSQSVLAAIRTRPGLVHGDLNGANLFVLPMGGYRVIDWQHSKLGPPELDLAILLDSMGHNPLHYVSEGIVPLMCLLRIHWFAQCATRWFPAGVADYDRQIARLAAWDG